MLRTFLMTLALGAALLPLPAGADVTFEFGNEFSGGQPTANNPFAEVTITDFAGGVTITVEATDLAPTEFIRSLYLNYGTTAIDVATLMNASQDLTSTQSYALQIASNAFKADGDGFYDILFSFPTSGDTFVDGDTATATFSLFGISSAFFNNLSAPGGGHGPFLGAMHVQGIGVNGDGSGWFSPTVKGTPRNVPGPLVGAGLPALLLLVFGGLTWMRRKSFRLGL